jgi:hypothetical protein
MRIRIPEPTTWRQPGRLYHFGDYRIPEDMSLELAERAIAEGAAVLIEEPKPKGKKASPVVSS